MVFRILKIISYYKVWGNTKACSSHFYAVVLDKGEGGVEGIPKMEAVNDWTWCEATWSITTKEYKSVNII